MWWHQITSLETTISINIFWGNSGPNNFITKVMVWCSYNSLLGICGIFCGDWCYCFSCKGNSYVALFPTLAPEHRWTEPTATIVSSYLESHKGIPSKLSDDPVARNVDGGPDRQTGSCYSWPFGSQRTACFWRPRWKSVGTNFILERNEKVHKNFLFEFINFHIFTGIIFCTGPTIHQHLKSEVSYGVTESSAAFWDYGVRVKACLMKNVWQNLALFKVSNILKGCL